MRPPTSWKVIEVGGVDVPKSRAAALTLVTKRQSRFAAIAAAAVCPFVSSFVPSCFASGDNLNFVRSEENDICRAPARLNYLFLSDLVEERRRRRSKDAQPKNATPICNR